MTRKEEWKRFAPTFSLPLVSATNPHRRWYQFWKPRFIWVKNPHKAKGLWRQVGKKVEVQIIYKAK